MRKKKRDGLTLLVIVLAILVGLMSILLVVTRLILPGIQRPIRKSVIRRELRLGRRYLSEMEYDKAVASFSEVVYIDDKNTEAYVGLGDAYTGMSKWTPAVQNYDQAVISVVGVLPEDGVEEEEIRVLIAQAPTQPQDEDLSIGFLDTILDQVFEDSEETDEDESAVFIADAPHMMDVIVCRDDALENGLLDLDEQGRDAEDLLGWLEEVGHPTYQPRDEVIAERLKVERDNNAGNPENTDQLEDVPMPSNPEERGFSGIVLDGESGQPVEGAIIYYRSGDDISELSAEADGTFRIVGIPAGTYTVYASCSGYKDSEPVTVVVEDGQITAIEDSFRMNRPPDWSSTYESFVMDGQYLRSGQEYWPADNFGDVKFALYDLDRDGTPELIAFNNGVAMAVMTNYFYTCDGEEGSETVRYIGNAGERGVDLMYAPESGYEGLFYQAGTTGYFHGAYVYMEKGQLKSETILQTVQNGPGQNDYEDEQITEDDALFDTFRGWFPFGDYEARGIRKLEMYTPSQIQGMGWEAFLERYE